MVSDEDKKATDEGRARELSPGKLLIWGRERAGLTQEQVAKELYMTLTKVRALEADDYRHMGSDTFTRGYLRAYANLIKIDVVQLLAAYDRHAQKHGLVEQVLPRKQESAAKPLWQFAGLTGAALFTLWLISVWFFDNRKAPDYDMPAAIVPAPQAVFSSLSASSPNASGPEQVPEQVISESVSTAAFDNAQTSSASSESSEAADMRASSSALESASSARATDPASQAAFAPDIANGLDKIVFFFSEECWLEVSDSRGDVLMTDLQAAGTKLSLQGMAPFEVKLGNAPAARIELNGRDVAVVPALGTNVLNLKVGESASE